MSAASILDSMVSVTSLNHGGASKALSQVATTIQSSYSKTISPARS